MSKKEEREIKKKHKDIAGMMAPPPTKEATNFEKEAAQEIEELERVDEEREERLERLRRRKLEWNAKRAQKTADSCAHTIDWPSSCTLFTNTDRCLYKRYS